MSIPGLVEIGANEVGIVRKKFGAKLPPGQYIALNGEAGYQADILPPGTHLGYFSLQYDVHKVPVVNVPPGEIGLVVAKDGLPIPRGRNLGRVVECNDFQDARAFLENGGEKGRQLGILTAGAYQINKELFTVITSANAAEHGVDPEDLQVYKVEPDKVGIVTTHDGKPILSGEIAGAAVGGHDNFQNAQRFVDRGGCNGLQEEVLPPGAWTLNPWFVTVEQVSLTKVEPGRVGVVVSHVGKTSHTSSDEPVEPGYKGVWKKPLYPGKHTINTRVMDVVLVPTHEITLDWSNKEKPKSNYDSSLRSLKLRSRDGFAFDIEVTQVIRIDGQDAPKMISRIGSAAAKTSDPDEVIEPSTAKLTSIRNLVVRVLEPMIGNYFRQSAQYYKALDFHRERGARQQDAIDHIKSALNDYGVHTVGTFINEIDLPDQLESILTRQEEAALRHQGHQIELQEQRSRQQLEHARAIADAQTIIVNTQVEAESIRQIGAAKADVLRLEVEAVGGFHNYLEKLRVDNWKYIQLPNVLVSSNGDRASLMDAFVAPMLGGSTVSNFQSLPGSSSAPQLPSSGSTTQPPQLGASLPRCPVVLLLDTSQAMSEEYLENLLEGINRFEQELSQDNIACRCIEVSVIAFGGSAKVMQSFAYAGKFSIHSLELGGTAATGQSIEIALKNIAHREALYKSQNIYHYKPLVILIIGSTPNDNWQHAVQKIKQAVAEDRLTFLTVGIEGVDMNILNQIAPPKTPPTTLKGLKFEPLFYGFANLLKRVANRQRRERLLEELATAVENTKSTLSQAQIQTLTEDVASLMAEVSKENPSQDNYIQISNRLIRATKNGNESERIADLIRYISKALGFS